MTEAHPADASGHTAFRDLLAGVLVSDVMVAGRQVVEVSTATDVVRAFQKVVNAGVLSAPVKDDETGEYIGFLDIRDLTKFVISAHEEHQQRQRKASGSLELPSLNLQHLFDVGARMPLDPQGEVAVKKALEDPDSTTERKITVRSMLVNPHNRFVSVKPADTLLTVAELLAEAHVHRVAVLDPSTGDVLDVVSQSTLIQFINQRKTELSELLSVTVEDSKIGSRPVIPVKSNASALECFRVMSRYNRSGIAIVDPDDGRYLGNTSASDLKAFIRNPEHNGRMLLRPVMTFLSKIRQANVSEAREFPTIGVRNSDSVSRVVGKLAATKIHRMFVAEDSTGYQPEACISLTDLLTYLLGRTQGGVRVDHA